MGGQSRLGSSAVVGLIAVVAVVVLAVGVGGQLLPDLNPFGSETRDRSQPALLRSLQRLSEYRAARANLQLIVDVEHEAKLLPAARLAPARVDLERTRVVDRERGLVDRAGDMLGGGGADEERQLLLLAQRKLDAAARAHPELLPTAERNTTAMLKRLARGLGFERVTVRFERPPAV